MNTKELLTKARALISDPEKWCQRYLAVNSLGTPVGADTRQACRWCAMGSLWYFRDLGEVSESTLDKAAAALRQMIGSSVAHVAQFNDSHIHADVIALFDKAIAAQGCMSSTG